ncbi:MAG: LamG domain-containing protein, partial [Gammaproteobacteria bacterium]|nr:LamG domain-containing protein [Gammaproteobacteria bacterium]
MFDKRITGYCDRLCAAPGETIEFKVSCEDAGTFSAEVVRILSGDDSAGAPGLREERVPSAVSGRYPARMQPVFPGSCVVIEEATARSSPSDGFTAAVMVFSTTPRAGRQVLMSGWSDTQLTGFELRINAAGAVETAIGNGQTIDVCAGATALIARRWYLLAVSFEPKTGRCTLWQKPMRPQPGDLSATAPVTEVFTLPSDTYSPASNEILCFGARWYADADPRPHGRFHFNGKLDSPRLCRRALDESELAALFSESIPDELAKDVIGWWDFSEGIDTEKVHDLSVNALHGRTVQLPARGMTGYNWTGAVQSWREDRREYGAIHFHDDDLIDAQWSTDLRFDVPADFASGVYALRLRPSGTETSAEGDDYITFFVRPPRGTATAKALFLI